MLEKPVAVVAMTREVAAVAFGVLAAGLQATGYLLYLRHAARAETRPNPASWFMFAYGTSLIVVLEMAVGGTWSLLLLPAACAAISVVVAVRAHRAPQPRLDPFDRAAFALDLALTGLYVLGRLLGDAHTLDTVLLVLAAATSIPAFVPLFRSTWRDPGSERAGPWLVWAGAYVLLSAATLADGSASALLLYPLVNGALHASVALLALRGATASP